MRKMKEQGLKPGVPDVVIAARTNYGHPGAYFEIKYGAGRVSPEQKRWRLLLQSQDYYCEVTRGLEETMASICNLYQYQL